MLGEVPQLDLQLVSGASYPPYIGFAESFTIAIGGKAVCSSVDKNTPVPASCILHPAL